MSLNQDNGDEIYSAENVYRKSSYGTRDLSWNQKCRKSAPLKYSRKQFLRGHSSCT